MTLSVRMSQEDGIVLHIYSGAVLVGVVAPITTVENNGKTFRWTTCFARPEHGDSASAQEAALAVAAQWRAWVKEAALVEAPADDDPYRLAFVAVHRALTAQRAAIDQLRGFIKPERERRRGGSRKGDRSHRPQQVA